MKKAILGNERASSALMLIDLFCSVLLVVAAATVASSFIFQF